MKTINDISDAEFADAISEDEWKMLLSLKAISLRERVGIERSYADVVFRRALCRLDIAVPVKAKAPVKKAPVKKSTKAPAKKTASKPKAKKTATKPKAPVKKSEGVTA